MRFSITYLNTMTLLSTIATAAPSKTTYEGLPYHHVDLMAYEKHGTSAPIDRRETYVATLDKRTEVTVCGQKISITVRGCWETFQGAVTMGTALAGAIYLKSKAKTCEAEHFTKEGFNYAVKAGGDSCHTTAQKATIEGAVEHYIETNLNKTTCGVQCFHLTHGGDWEGYVVFGKDDYDWNYFLDECSQVGKLGQCSSGGKKDVLDPRGSNLLE